MDALVTLPLAWWGPLAAITYAGLCLLLGERFPFSKYRMYSNTRNSGALPTFWADGEIAAVDDYVEFAGIDPNGLYPKEKGLECSLEWQVFEAQRWFREHSAQAGSEAGPITVQYGFRILRVDKDGNLSEQLFISAEGTAHRR